MAKGYGHSANSQSSKKQAKSKLDFDSSYEQLQISNPVLVTNRMFWSRKGNSQKYMCVLCNISVQMSNNLSTLKTAVLNHVQDKYHMKRYDSYMSKANNITKEDSLTEEQKVKAKEKNNKKSILTLFEEAEESVLGIENLKVHNNAENTEEPYKDIGGGGDKLVDFNTIYESFEKRNPVIKSSKEFITKYEDGRHFFCKLCDRMIFNSLNANDFRYNLWVHLNEEVHRKKLPNFREVQEEFDKVMENASKTMPSYSKYELKYFEIGPVFQFVKCSICEVAVSVNLHRLENHIRGKDHVERRNLAFRNEVKKEWVSDRTRDAFRKLVVKLGDQFKKDIKYLHIGKIPGYVVCSLCTYVVLSTQFYVETHFESAVHLKNKTTSDVNRQSKFKVRLVDLMNTLPNDLKDFNIFEENVCGLTCTRCQASIPATSYDLYSHITKERHPFNQ